MKTIKFIRTLILIMSLAGIQLDAQTDNAAPPIPSQEVPEILNQGPIHEAFAQPVDLVTESGIISPQEPPTDIIENPADEKPESSDYLWIPGYWAWDAERSDYLWVSGCWRIAPTGMTWVPGYWNKVSDSWQWVAGFWISTTQAEQIQYLPQPPEITETTPPSSEVASDKIWVPPCYYWHTDRYIPRAGYWLEPRDDWVWIPSHYTWTPNGYVFVSGYWDYGLDTRGILYAPIYFPRHFHRPRNFTYSLGVVVNISNLDFCLFSYPRYRHYYFGDYYSDFHVSIGIFPWYEFQKRHNWYDPIYEHKRCRYRKYNPHWGEHIRNEYNRRHADAKRRPPRTYHDIKSRMLNTPKKQRENFRFVEPVRKYTENKNAAFKFSKMNKNERHNIFGHADKVNKFRQQRRKLESHHLDPTIVKPSRIFRSSDRITPKKDSRPVGPSKLARPDTRSRIRTATQGKAQPGSQSRIRTATPGRDRPGTQNRTLPAKPNSIRRNPPAKAQPAKPNSIRRNPPAKAQPAKPNSIRHNPPAKARPAKPNSIRHNPPAKARPAKPNTIRHNPPAKAQPAKPNSIRHNPPAKAQPAKPNTIRHNPPAKARPAKPNSIRHNPPAKAQPAKPNTIRHNPPAKARPAKPNTIRQPSKQASGRKITEKRSSPKQKNYTKSTNKKSSFRSISSQKTPSLPKRKPQVKQHKNSDQKKKSGRKIGRGS